ncbi:GAF domain-containing serine/threonine phosphatase [Amycolatopsis mediterranei S699]|uniref:GAF domain-containing serine/threonine phosphatase n=2 Tax=Amycolatopsis mediterranei TaxID=33910 RepID=A0A0H3D9D8_AMYMU|nr:GAF domain-containing SpoIIE family protein phosphatase [Amycolatopsis mediterranei]ADJ47630.1 GAF domain-containing serine/threonine phosphatase [Amycolatopsis mediterranei U32]AEK44514.1 GAF domain-containing serine/threonine phosphatase [Amycolatopsis mediterranei S699]AFO79341.1 GAF domain-containing serine/threonine phosphatase [Amycolatopsis mediterranei S699]AGT86469.1 GAF domain-containing serine/threonine phosphatase [Amycolatopsis mediterranei RB]KDO11919.1 diguanylate phosphodies
MSRSLDAENRLQQLEAIIGAPATHLGLAEMLAETLQRLREVMAVDTATVLRYQPSGRQLVAFAAAGIEEEVHQGVRVPVGRGFAGRVALERAPVILDHVDETTVVNSLLWERGLHSMLGVPMIAGGELVGVLHIGSVALRQFGESEVITMQLLADRLAMAVQVEALEENRTATMALQRSLLPSSLPEVPGLAFGARYVPGAETGLGGDWYDLFSLPGDRLGVVMGDVSGHGLDAAVIMGRLRSALRAYALDCESPAEVLAKLDRKANHFEHGAMATVAYGIIGADRETLTLSLAGHLPPVLALPGAAARLVDSPPDPPIGLTIGVPERRTTVVELPSDGVLVFYTDGLVERRDRPVDVGMEQLAQAVRAGDPEWVCAQVMAAMIGSRPAQDDVAVLAIRRRDVPAGA